MSALLDKDISLRRYGAVGLSVLLALLLRFALTPLLADGAPLLIFIMPVVVSAWFGGLYPGLVATLLGGLLGSYFFVTPAWSLAIEGSVNITRVIMFSLEGVLISLLSGALHASSRRSALAAQQLQQSEERYRLIIEGAKDYAIFMLDKEGCISSWNHGAERLLGYRHDEAIGQPAATLFTPEDRKAGVPHQELTTASQEGSANDERWHLKKDGSRFWATGLVTPLRHANGQLQSFVKVMRDSTDRKQVEDELARQMKMLAQAKAELEQVNKQLHHDAFHDALTGLPNRALFLDRLQHVTERLKRHPEAGFAVLFLDFDRFKVINDSLGHAIGDALLKAVSQRLSQSLRPADTIARLGGDEFAVLLEDLNQLEEAIMVVERLQQELAYPFSLNEHTIHTSVSIGIVYCQQDYPEDVLRAADIAMYAAKAQGKARYAVFNKAMQDAAANLQAIEVDLRGAVEKGELEVHYQPLMRTTTSELAGFEALVRWQHPRLGLVPPTHFIPIAEETGLIIELDRWVLREACRQLRFWQQQYPHEPVLSLNVNISGQQFLHNDLTSFVASVLEETELEASSLKLEATESVLLNPRALAAMNSLKALGVEVHIDDFGTGYSSLSYLQQYPVTALKIDRSFINRMLETPESKELVRSMVGMAHNLGMAVVAEGVESQAQLKELQTLGADYAQGYFFSKALPAKEVTAAFLSLVE